MAARTLEEICEMEEMKKKTPVTISVLATANILRECSENEKLSSLVLALRKRFATWIEKDTNYQLPEEKNCGKYY